MIHFKCPGCQQQYQVNDNAAGKVRSCPACGKHFRIPEPASDDELIPVAERDVQRVVRRERVIVHEHRSPERPQNLSTWSLVLSLVGLILNPLAIAGLVLGIMALNRPEEDRVRATIGTCLSGFVCAVWALIVLLAIGGAFDGHR